MKGKKTLKHHGIFFIRWHKYFYDPFESCFAASLVIAKPFA